MHRAMDRREHFVMRRLCGGPQGANALRRFKLEVAQLIDMGLIRRACPRGLVIPTLVCLTDRGVGVARMHRWISGTERKTRR